jgi:plasmid stabilization system protein ParE
MPKLVFHPDIASEIKASYTWYQEQAVGLGDDFIAELESAYEAITELPKTWPKFQRGFRRYLLTRFPFSVIYKDTNESIFVVSVMHNSRKPGYWVSRI